MRLHVDLETLQLIEGPGFRNPVTSLRFKRGDGARLEVVFLENGTTPATIGDPATLELRFGVKPRGRYESGYLVHTADWTLPAAGASPPVYGCSPSFNTVELNAVLGVDSLAGPELAEVTLMGEVTWREGAGAPTSTRTFLVVVENDVNRGTEGAPTGATPAYPAPGQLALASDLAAHISDSNPHHGIMAVLPQDSPITAGCYQFQSFPGFNIELPHAGVWELDGRFTTYQDDMVSPEGGATFVEYFLAPGPLASVRVHPKGHRCCDFRPASSTDKKLATGMETVRTWAAETVRMVGYVETTGPLTLTALVYTAGAPHRIVGAGSWIRATLLTIPSDYYYGAGPIGGELL